MKIIVIVSLKLLDFSVSFPWGLDEQGVQSEERGGPWSRGLGWSRSQVSPWGKAELGVRMAQEEKDSWVSSDSDLY